MYSNKSKKCVKLQNINAYYPIIYYLCTSMCNNFNKCKFENRISNIEMAGACYCIMYCLLYDNMLPCVCRVKKAREPLPSSRNSNFEADVLEIKNC